MSILNEIYVCYLGLICIFLLFHRPYKIRQKNVENPIKINKMYKQL